MPGRARTTARIRVLALAVVVLALIAGSPTQTPRAAAAPLVPGTDFQISTTITSSATSATTPALLYPGVTRYLWYSVANPLPQPITVTALGIDRVDAPLACPAENLDLGDPTFSGSFVVPAGTTKTVPAPMPISLVNLPDVNQDACKNVTFTFALVGTALVSDGPGPVDPEPVTKVGTATVLVASPDRVARGNPVTAVAHVTTIGESGTTRANSFGRMSGAMSFYLRAPGGERTLLGTAAVGPDGTATLRLSTLPAGAASLYAVFGGSADFAASTSPLATVEVIAPPALCTGTYTTSIIATPDTPVVTGTKGNDFIYAVGGDHRVRGLKGNDCLVVGDGTNVVRDGSGADVVIAGDGRNTIKVLSSGNTIVVGNGSGNHITVKGTKKRGSGTRRNPSANRITVGDGDGTRITVGRAHRNRITVGDGSASRILIRAGSRNLVQVGDGAGNRIKVARGNRNQVVVGGGAGNRVRITRGKLNQIRVGGGDRNRIRIRRGNRNEVAVGDGARNVVFLRMGRANRITVGDGGWNRIRIRAGSRNRLTVGDGDSGRVFVRAGNRNRITMGDGDAHLVAVRGIRNRIRLGAGQDSTAIARRGSARTVCILPVPPRLWRGSAVAYYRDSITRCRVVTR